MLKIPLKSDFKGWKSKQPILLFPPKESSDRSKPPRVFPQALLQQIQNPKNHHKKEKKNLLENFYSKKLCKFLKSPSLSPSLSLVLTNQRQKGKEKTHQYIFHPVSFHLSLSSHALAVCYSSARKKNCCGTLKKFEGKTANIHTHT